NKCRKLIQISLNGIFYTAVYIPNFTHPTVLSIPQEVANTAGEIDARENFLSVLIGYQIADPIIIEHLVSEFGKTLTTTHPARWNDHHEVSRLNRHGLLYKMVVNWRCASSVPPVVKLIWWVSDYHVKLHVAPEELGHSSLDIVGVDEGISMGFHVFAAVVGGLACPAELALAIHPCVLGPLKSNVAFVAAKTL